MASEVSICNMALVRLGQQRISSLTVTGNNLRVELCNVFYEATRDELLAAYEWSFALSRTSLPELSLDNYTDYSYMYMLPSDDLRTLCILDSSDFSETEEDWRIEGDYLYSNVSPAYIKYIKRVSDTSLFPPLFIEALYLRLATKMCLKLAQDQSLLTILFQEYSIAMQSAMCVSGANSKRRDKETVLWSS